MNSRTWILWIVVCLSIVFALVSYNRFASRLPHEITIASGSPVGMYHQLALKLKELIEQEHPSITVKVRETNGSAENLELLTQRAVDFAFHQNNGQTQPEIRNVANLYSEVLHLVIRRESGIEQLQDLAGKRVSVGAEGSGTYQMTQEVLNHYHLPMSSLRVRTLDFQETVAAFQHGDLDAAFVVSGILSPALVALLREGNYDLLSLQKTQALTFKNPAFFVFSIPQTAYWGDPPIPSEDVQCLAIKASLITHRQVSAYLVRLVTETALSITFRKQMHLRELDETYAQDEQDFPLHRGAWDYYNRGRPTLSSTLMEAIQDTLPFLLILAILILLVGATLRSRTLERQRVLKNRLHELMVQVSDIEEDQRGETDVRQLFRSLDQLSRIKKRAVEDRVHGLLPADFEYVAFMIQLDALVGTIHGKLKALEHLEMEETPEEETLLTH